jgi:phosphatidylserine decarboxylase
MPIAGKLRSMRYVPGNLFSVHPKVVDRIPNLFAKNERVVTIFDTVLGPMAVILVGAMIVGSIETKWEGVITPDKQKKLINWDYSTQDLNFTRGSEIGRFKLGSTVILLFPSRTIKWQESLQPDAPLKMGQNLGELLKK